MADPPDNTTREERLAAKLRENLRRRKAQSRAMDARTVDSRESGKDGLSKDDDDS